MQKTPSKIHRTVVFIGLAAALALCVFSCIALGRTRPPRARPSIEELDAKAKPESRLAPEVKQITKGIL